MTDPQTIEAVARAIWNRRNPHRPDSFPDSGLMREMLFADAQAAIAAFLAASGVGRDAERYRWLRDQMNKRTRHDPVIACVGNEDDGVMFCEEADAAIDIAMREEAARGGEHV